MKRIFQLWATLLAVMVAMASPAEAAGQEPSLSGRVVDDKGEAIPYATVVLLRDEQQVAGQATDDQGGFAFVVAAGRYTLKVQYVGYNDHEEQVEAPAHVGDILLEQTATEIASVEVMAPQIRREADRFIVDVGNSTVAIGKTGAEMLETAPGVWVANDQISINGRSGSKIYVNERELKMEGEQLMQYLRSLRAEDISKIEVVPLSGADFDADTSAGVIKITLKRRRDDGLQGSVGYTFQGSEYGSFHNPHLNLDYNTGSLNLYASGWFNGLDQQAESLEDTHYHTTAMQLRSESLADIDQISGGGRLGAVWEISKRHSVGAEVEYWNNSDEQVMNSTSQVELLSMPSTTESQFLGEGHSKNVGVALNYIYKLDTLGSHLKLMADYTRRTSDNHNDKHSTVTSGSLLRDSTYYDTSDNLYDILTATLQWEQRLAPKWNLKAGAKYTRNDTQNSALYRFLQGEAWLPSSTDDFDIRYTENIGALYAIVSGRVGRISLSAGLRGEYTSTSGREADIEQNYFSLFPNAHLAWSMDKAGKHNLVASYARTINRPGFWALSPTRHQISDYFYQTGNPNLKPGFTNSYSLNLVLWYQYSLSMGIYRSVDAVQQTMQASPTDKEMICLTWTNYPAYNIYFANLSLPVQLTKWWRWNTNLNYMYMGQRMEVDAPLEYNHFLSLYTAMTFQLPKKFILEASYMGSTPWVLGNVEVASSHDLSLSLKKRLCKNRLTLFVEVGNLIDYSTKLISKQPEFERTYEIRQVWGSRSYRAGLTYNFSAGKAFQKRTVESGSSEERGRLQSK